MAKVASDKGLSEDDLRELGVSSDIPYFGHNIIPDEESRFRLGFGLQRQVRTADLDLAMPPTNDQQVKVPKLLFVIKFRGNRI